MELALKIVWPLVFLSFPFLAGWLARQHRFLNFLGPVVMAYVVGVALGNIPGLGIPEATVKPTYELAIAISLPLLLFNADFLRWLRTAGSAVIGYGLAVLSVLTVAGIVGFAFTFEDSPRLMGMMVGAATGGTVNLNSVGTALQVPDARMMTMNFTDIFGGAIYFLFLISVAKPVLGRFLKPYPHSTAPAEASLGTEAGQVPIQAPKWQRLGLAVGAGVVALAVAFGFASGIEGLLLSTGLAAPDAAGGTAHILLPILMLSLTTLGIAGSFVPRLRHLDEAAQVGDYFVVVFCVGLGSQVSFESFTAENMSLIGLGLSIIYGSIVLHLLLCWLFRVDVDTAIMASSAAIMSPPLLGPIAERLGNRQALISGLTTGIVGYAVGTYLGIGLALLIENLRG